MIQIQYLLMTGRLKRWFGRSSAAAVCLLFVVSPVFADDLVVTWSFQEKVRINEMQSWILHIETEDGTPIEGATIEVDGGMPEHDHGLPTRPRVTEDLGGGDYKLEGLRFHMRGYWELVLTITTDDGEFKEVIPLRL